MTRTDTHVVVDASAIVALLTDRGELGGWAAEEIRGRLTAAPRLMPYEAGNVLRRGELAGRLDATAAGLAHRDLLAMPITLWPHHLLADRAWELRGSLSYYDACYVALAELLHAPLLTLDRHMARAPGPMCRVLAPPAG